MPEHHHAITVRQRLGQLGDSGEAPEIDSIPANQQVGQVIVVRSLQQGARRQGVSMRQVDFDPGSEDQYSPIHHAEELS